MNFNYKLRQLKNALNRGNVSSIKNWIFIYGAPRSGTSFVFHKFLEQAKNGISDWELHRVIDTLDYYQGQTHIGLDRDLFSNDLLNNIMRSGQPGAGSNYDLVIKEIDCPKYELDYLINTIKSEPTIKLFMYRSPEAWYKSAKIKFGLGDKELIELYNRSLESYFDIGGQVLEYDYIASDPWLANMVGEIKDFNPKNEEPKCPEELIEIFKKFQLLILKD